MKNQKGNVEVVLIVVGAFVLLLLMGGCAVFMPKYRIYSQDMKGQANLRQEEWEKKIQIEEAKAKYESSKMLAAAEVERAKGVAEANKIIGESLRGNESYLRYLWVQGLNDGSGEVIYVPTEANLPVLEAGKR